MVKPEDNSAPLKTKGERLEFFREDGRGGREKEVENLRETGAIVADNCSNNAVFFGELDDEEEEKPKEHSDEPTEKRA